MQIVGPKPVPEYELDVFILPENYRDEARLWCTRPTPQRVTREMHASAGGRFLRMGMMDIQSKLRWVCEEIGVTDGLAISYLYWYFDSELEDALNKHWEEVERCRFARAQLPEQPPLSLHVDSIERERFLSPFKLVMRDEMVVRVERFAEPSKPMTVGRPESAHGPGPWLCFRGTSREGEFIYSHVSEDGVRRIKTMLTCHGSPSE